MSPTCVIPVGKWVVVICHVNTTWGAHLTFIINNLVALPSSQLSSRRPPQRHHSSSITLLNHAHALLTIAMYDSEFDHYDDSFAVDDSFLRQLDDIEVNAASTRPSATAAPAPLHTPVLPRNAQAGPSRPRIAGLGASRRAAALGVRLPQTAPHPSSDDYGDMSFSAESLEQIDQAARPKGTTVIPSSGILRQRTFARTTSGSMLQTHLNFRRENPYTKGKRWDRTAFAASGRRRAVVKKTAKGKARTRYDDDDDDKEDDCDEPLAPDPAPLVDTCERGHPL